MLLTRRKFLALTSATALSGATPPLFADNSSPRIGLALGGGGARGLAHVAILQAMEEIGVRPSHIAGTSIGAVVGALYGLGRNASSLKSLMQKALEEKKSGLGLRFLRNDILKWIHLVDSGIDNKRVLDSSDFLSFLDAELKDKTFADLNTKLSVVSADIWQHEQVVMNNGDLLQAVRASVAIPGLFNPVEREGHVLVDGGAVNPVPYDLLFEDCDIVIAVDVAGQQKTQVGTSTFFGILFNTIKTMEKSIMREKLKRRPPHIYITPPLENIHLLDFGRAEEIYQLSQASADALKNQLQRYLAPHTT